MTEEGMDCPIGVGQWRKRGDCPVDPPNRPEEDNDFMVEPLYLSAKKYYFGRSYIIG